MANPLLPRRYVAVVLVTGALILAGVRQGWSQQRSELTTPAGGNGASQRAEVSQWIGPVKVTIAYHSPGTQRANGPDRSGHIWGEVVPYGFVDEGFGPSHATPWRAGANESTTIAFSDDVRVNGRDIKAGAYAVFLDVEKDAPWVWIFSSHAVGWGSYQYNAADDVLRVPATPEQAPHTKFLTYGFDDRRESAATVFLQWDTTRIAFTIQVPNVAQVYVDRMRTELEGWPGFDYRNWQIAAQFCADHKINLPEALQWANRAIDEPFRGAAFGRLEFATLQTKAAVLTAMGRTGEAAATMDTALALPGTPAVELHFYAASVLGAGQLDRALQLFKMNKERHPEEPYWTYLGLARGYTAAGDTTNAIANLEIALEHVPPSQRATVANLERTLAALKTP